MTEIHEKLPQYDLAIDDYEWGTDAGEITGTLFGGGVIISRDQMIATASKSAVELEEGILTEEYGGTYYNSHLPASHFAERLDEATA